MKTNWPYTDWKTRKPSILPLLLLFVGFLSLVVLRAQPMRITSFEIIKQSPGQNFVLYTAATGSQSLILSSNWSDTARISYVSPVPCALFYNHELREAATNCVGGGCVIIPGFTRMSGTLPAGTNTVTLPVSRGEVGFIRLQKFP